MIAKACVDCIDRVIVTTDDPRMHKIALKYDVAMRGLRPRYLSGDRARSIDVLTHVIKRCDLGNTYIMMLQPSSPLRTVSDLRAVIGILRENPNRCEAVASVTKLTSTHPNKVQKIKGGYLTSFISGAISERPRQELPAVYRLNGAFYLTHAATILKKKTLLPKKTIPYIMPEERSINLDRPWDVLMLNLLLDKKIVNIEEY